MDSVRIIVICDGSVQGRMESPRLDSSPVRMFMNWPGKALVWFDNEI